MLYSDTKRSIPIEREQESKVKHNLPIDWGEAGLELSWFITTMKMLPFLLCARKLRVNGKALKAEKVALIMSLTSRLYIGIVRNCWNMG